MPINPNEFYSLEDREEMQDELRDQEEMRLQAEKLGHYPVDDGYCACGFLCETGTRFDRHIKAVLERGSQGGSRGTLDA